MALTELRSDLSWYGKTAPGFRPNTDRNNTDFQYNADLTSTVAEQGFSERGEAVGFRRITSANAFAINSGQDAQGTARRITQLGAGSKFPVGPFGDVHEFDQARTGFSPVSRYGDIYSAKTTAGLADTYTANSPIDDMYNRYKVRDEAYNPFPYAREPFILRGIQRDDNSDPQRWGILPDVRSEIPRGGAVTAVQRLAIDAARIGKFLITPNGLSFIAKQQALHLMSPNTEGNLGTAISGLSNKPVYNPLSAFSNMTLHMASNVQVSRYGDIINDRKPLTTEVSANRLVRLSYERSSLLSTPIGDKTAPWVALSAPTGPNSFGGIGATIFPRVVESDTSLNTILEKSTATISDRNKRLDVITRYRLATDTYTQPYQKVKDESFLRSREDIDTTDATFPVLGTVEQSLRKRVETDKQFKGFTDEPTENPPDSNSKTTDVLSNFNVMTYDQVRAITRDRVNGRVASQVINAVPRDPTNGGVQWEAGNIPMGTFIDTSNDKQLETHIPDDTQNPSLCTFKIGGINFHAYLQALSDTSSPQYEETTDATSYVNRKRITGFMRSINVSFTVVIERRGDFADQYKRIDSLYTLAQPLGVSTPGVPDPNTGASTAATTFRTRPVRLRIGDLINLSNCVITDLTIDWDNESPWEITPGIQAPLYSNISISFEKLIDSAGEGGQRTAVQTSRADELYSNLPKTNLAVQ